MGEPDLFGIPEWREERAAILEFDAGIPRDEAERQAEQMVQEWVRRCEARRNGKDA